MTFSAQARGDEFDRQLQRRHRRSNLFAWVCRISTWAALGILVVLLTGVIWKSSGRLTLDFLTNYPSILTPEKAGLMPAIWGSLWLVVLTGCFSIPLGVGAAVYLEEYAPTSSWITRLIKVNLSNLAGVPSIVYGILGLTVFVRFFGKAMRLPMMEEQFLPLGRTVLAGSLTLTLLILPIVIIASQEALRAIPSSIRHASVALGATRWQTIRLQILPPALPGIATGLILALSRALGETAPIVVVGTLLFTRETPGQIESPVDIVRHPSRLLDVPGSEFTTLPVQIYNWISDAETEFHLKAAAGILVLLTMLLLINGTAILIRNRFQKHVNW